ncbi:MAG: ankyrin repeat domain-containing protein [Cardiobacteriaceae bacterium]|nr:ankyrin repeat domain-containing protein [Cardiobacteriaceae bacterium]
MKRILISALALSLGAYAQENTRLQQMAEMEYVDEARCHIAISNSVQSVIPLLALAWLEAGDSTQKNRIREAFDVALARGCDINAASLDGLNALHLAVIKGDGELVQYLLAHNADPGQTISSNDPHFNGLNSHTLLEWLEKEEPTTDRKRVKEMLDSKR